MDVCELRGGGGRVEPVEHVGRVDVTAARGPPKLTEVRTAVPLTLQPVHQVAQLGRADRGFHGQLGPTRRSIA